MLLVTKAERIRSRLFAIEAWSYKLRRTTEGYPESMRKGIKLLHELTNDLWILVNTGEEEGKKLGWWE